ncbi:MAG: DUF1524 domain-containing protein, partial [candidate division Zixibacteria bacterium]|nr:DUF1524 domain-containing protein [candidate division Zixibacteria bacterium]
NKPFLEKKDILLRKDFPLPAALAEADDWNAEAIAKRTKELAVAAYNVYWKI